ncbi:hypothetical protein EJB05_12255, partial [Eragrostis curvula]
MDLSSVLASSASYGKAAETYKKAVTVAATAAAYTMVAHRVSRELLPDELRGVARWAVAFVRDRLQDELHAMILSRASSHQEKEAACSRQNHGPYITHFIRFSTNNKPGQTMSSGEKC